VGAPVTKRRAWFYLESATYDWFGLPRMGRNGFDSRYLVYLNNRAAGKGSVKTIDLCDQKTAPLTPKSFIYNRRSYSFENVTFKLLIPLIA